MTNDSEFLYVEEIARLCRVPASSVRHWLSTGKLASVRPGRRRLVRRDDLDRFLQATSGPRRSRAAVAPAQPGPEGRSDGGPP
jgi:excisionase family DNA binding protein